MSFRHPTGIEASTAALKADLLGDQGPQISTVRNHNFAILPYPPAEEFAMHRAMHELTSELLEAGWNTDTIDLHKLLLRRIKAEGSDLCEAIIQREKSLAGAADGSRGLRMLKERLVNLLDRADGLAAEVIAGIDAILGRTTSPARTVIFLGRLGALYPFMRTSALLKQIAGHTHNIPLVLLYPGIVVGETGLSFMGVLPADRDYRPRIYR